jgi:hypothetical protein
MRSIWYGMMLVLLATIQPLRAADSFEGTAVFDIREAGANAGRMTYSIQGTNLRLEADMKGSEGATMILRTEEKRILMLMPDQAMYMEMPMREDAGQATAGETAPEPVRTGKTETILGRSCEEIEVKDKDGTVTQLWVTTEVGSFMLFSGNPMSGMPGGKPAKSRGWEKVFRGSEAWFPMRIVSKKGGREEFRMEAKEIRPGKLAASMFEVPAGWQKFSMPAGMPGMGGR